MLGTVSRSDLETLKARYGQELDTIVRAVCTETLKRTRPDIVDVRSYIADHIVQHLKTKAKFAKSKGIELGSIENQLRNSSMFILAQILQTEYVKSWEDFKAEVRRRVPNYAAYPRELLRLGNLPWRVRFPIPEAKKYKKPPPHPSPTNQAHQQGESGSAVKVVVERFEERMGEVERQIRELASSIRTELSHLRHILTHHAHIGNTVYKPLTDQETPSQ